MGRHPFFVCTEEDERRPSKEFALVLSTVRSTMKFGLQKVNCLKCGDLYRFVSSL